MSRSPSRKARTISSVALSVMPPFKARKPAAWIAGPSAIGSVNGMPISMRSAPAAGSARRMLSEVAPSGSPAMVKVTRGPRDLRARARRSRRVMRVSMRLSRRKCAAPANEASDGFGRASSLIATLQTRHRPSLHCIRAPWLRNALAATREPKARDGRRQPHRARARQHSGHRAGARLRHPAVPRDATPGRATAWLPAAPRPRAAAALGRVVAPCPARAGGADGRLRGEPVPARGRPRGSRLGPGRLRGAHAPPALQGRRHLDAGDRPRRRRGGTDRRPGGATRLR